MGRFILGHETSLVAVFKNSEGLLSISITSSASLISDNFGIITFSEEVSSVSQTLLVLFYLSITSLDSLVSDFAISGAITFFNVISLVTVSKISERLLLIASFLFRKIQILPYLLSRLTCTKMRQEFLKLLQPFS